MSLIINGKNVNKVVIDGVETPSVYYRKGEGEFSLVFTKDPTWIEFKPLDPFGDGSTKAFLTFDGDTLDKVGSYNGVATGTTFKTGKFNQAIEINSSGANVSINKQDLIDFTKTFAISFWIKPLVENSSYQGVFSKPVPSGQNFSPFCIHKVNNKLQYFLTSANSVWNISSGTLGINNITLNEWHHLVFQRTTSGYKAYVNGVLDFSIDTTTNLWINTHNYLIGTAFPGTQDFKGQVDNFRVFNRDLTLEEINRLFTEKALIL